MDTPHAITALTEVQSREDYLQSFSSPPLQKLIMSCLHNQPKQQPNISTVCEGLKSLKAAESQKVPFSTSNSVELLDSVWQAQLKNEELCNSFDERVDQQLLQLKHENNLLQQQLQAKDQQLKTFVTQAEDQNEKVMDQFMQESEQYQYHMQNALSAQEQMFKMMDQVSRIKHWMYSKC